MSITEKPAALDYCYDQYLFYMTVIEKENPDLILKKESFAKAYDRQEEQYKNSNYYDPMVASLYDPVATTGKVNLPFTQVLITRAFASEGSDLYNPFSQKSLEESYLFKVKDSQIANKKELPNVREFSLDFYRKSLVQRAGIVLMNHTVSDYFNYEVMDYFKEKGVDISQEDLREFTQNYFDFEKVVEWGKTLLKESQVTVDSYVGNKNPIPTLQIFNTNYRSDFLDISNEDIISKIALSPQIRVELVEDIKAFLDAKLTQSIENKNQNTLKP